MEASLGRQAKQVARSSLLQPSLRPPLEINMLPQLNASELGRLSTTCQAANAWLAEFDPSLWRAAAARHLPWQHPWMDRVGTADVRRALQWSNTVAQNIKQGRPTYTKTISSVSLAFFSPKRDMLAAFKSREWGSGQCLLCVFDSFSGEQIQVFNMPFNVDHGNKVVFSPDSQDLITYSMILSNGSSEETLRWYIANMASGKCCTYEWPGGSALINVASLSPDGRYLANGRTGAEWQVRDVRTGALLQGLPAFWYQDGWSGVLPFRNGGRYLVGNRGEHDCAIYDTVTGMLTEIHDCWRVEFSPNDQAIACFQFDNSHLTVTRLENDAISEDSLFIEGRTGEYVEFTADCTLFAVEVAHEIWVAQLGPAQVIYRTAIECHQGAFMSFAPTGGLLAFMGKNAIHLHQVTGEAAGEVCTIATSLHAGMHESHSLESYLGLGWTHCSLLMAAFTYKDMDMGMDICLLSFAPY